jgi:hypothetical protein
MAHRCAYAGCPAEASDLWLCCHAACTAVFCGRTVKGHALAHFKETGHAVVIARSTTMMWCYACDVELKESPEHYPDEYNQAVRAHRLAVKSGVSGVPLPGSTKRLHGVAAPAGPAAVGGGGGGGGGGVPPPAPAYEAIRPTAIMPAVGPGATGRGDPHTPLLLTYPPTGGLTGLANQGNTCFFNAGLQCLSNVSPLALFLAEVGFAARPGGDSMPTAFKSLMADMWFRQHAAHPYREGDTMPYVTPVQVFRHLRRINPLFEGFQQQDAHEALRATLNELHERLSVDVPMGLYTQAYAAAVPALARQLSGGKMGSAVAAGSTGSAGGGGGGAGAPAAAAGGSGSGGGGGSDGGREGRSGKEVDSDDDDYAGSPDAKRPRMENGSVRSAGEDAAAAASSPARSASTSSRHRGGRYVPPPGREWLVDGPYTGPDTVPRSVVSDLFQGIFCSRVRCRSCGTDSVTFDTFFDLSVPIPRKSHPLARGGDGTRHSEEAYAWAARADGIDGAEEGGGGGRSGRTPAAGVGAVGVPVEGADDGGGGIVVNNAMRSAAAATATATVGTAATSATAAAGSPRVATASGSPSASGAHVPAAAATPAAGAATAVGKPARAGGTDAEDDRASTGSASSSTLWSMLNWMWCAGSAIIPLPDMLGGGVGLGDCLYSFFDW